MRAITGCEMDKILKDLKSNRETVEDQFNDLMGRLAALQENLDQKLQTFEEKLEKCEDSYSEELFNICIEFHRQSAEFIQGFRDMVLLQNARSAELARQLTVLPIDRMDLVLEGFDKRLEDFECRIQRLEKPTKGE